MANDFNGYLQVRNGILEATIADAGTVSTVIDLAGLWLNAIQTPASLGQTAITISACETQDGTFLPVFKADGDALGATVDASTAGIYAVDPQATAGLRFVKLTAGGAVSGAKTLKVHGRGL